MSLLFDVTCIVFCLIQELAHVMRPSRKRVPRHFVSAPDWLYKDDMEEDESHIISPVAVKPAVEWVVQEPSSSGPSDEGVSVPSKTRRTLKDMCGTPRRLRHHSDLSLTCKKKVYLEQ